ncbi:alpha/beta fold hydrolase [Kribbella sp. GL6]|uniref:alpha/beta fold hydrolase n=1 Tax=Kribbella sp. GL6 TaxID=3419765 RepID=UPI003CFD1BE6
MSDWRVITFVGGATVLASVGAAFGAWVERNLRSSIRGLHKVERAGYTEQQALIDGSVINYGRGPDRSGPVLLLIHGQAVDWKQYYRVLPQLAEDFRVFAVDVYGHGGSDRVPSKYCATAIGADLAAFIEQEIGEPVVVAGHSSGGQLAAWIAGHRPDLVRGVVLEDPPLLTTQLPRAEKTWNWVDLATACHEFLALPGPELDWPAYYFAHQRLWKFFGKSAKRIIRRGLATHAKAPDRPITLFFMPPGWNDMQRTLRSYDPRFGDAFYTGDWDTGFDQQKTLESITAPTTLIHANWRYGDDGVLQGAMDGDDAARVTALIDGAALVRVNSGHNVHGERPKEFLKAVRDLMTRL